MLTNSNITIYHKVKIDHEFKWKRFNYYGVWVFETNGSTQNNGISNSNSIVVRIPYTKKINIDNFGNGDIIVNKILTNEIEKQQDIKERVFIISSINDNKFGNNQHIHLIGK